MSGVIKTVKKAVKKVFHGVGELFEEVGKVWSKITPWNDDTTLGKVLNVAALATAGYFGGSALGLWGQEAAGTTTAGVLAESSGSGSLFSAAGIPTTATGAVDFGSNLGMTGAAIAAETGTTGMGGSLSLMPAVTSSVISTTPATIANSINLLTPAEQAASQGGLFTSVLNTIKKAGLGALEFAKKHPLATGMIASGAIQGLGSMMQAEALQRMKEKELEEEKRQFNLLHSMGLNTNVPRVLSPIERLRLRTAQQQILTPQEIQQQFITQPVRNFETRAGRLSQNLNDLLPLLQNYYTRGNIGLFTLPY